MDNTTKIAITGLGVTSPLGNTISKFWENILAGNSAVQNWTDLEALDFKYSHACRIPSVECDPLLRGFTLSDLAIGKALKQASIVNRGKTGLFLGTTMGESAAFEQAAEGNKTIDLKEYNAFGVAKRLARAIGNVEYIQCYGTACAAGNYAIKGAVEALKSGHVDVAIAGGMDPFSKIAMTGFSRSRAMTPSGVCRPFDSVRDGMLLGEGAGFLVLERASDAESRGATIIATAGGCGITCDAYHPTAPKPDSSGVIRCMQLALQQNQLQTDQIDWICAHGTGTKLSDHSEAQAINQVFNGSKPAVTSIKANIGHTLGAATALEAIVCALSIQHGVIPPTANHTSSDFELNVPIAPIQQSVNHILNCGYAFGGLNSALIFSKWN